ncbi:ubinuclein-1-like isoform X3 [Homarus americanus]|uniref:ubinuclein-1-like isoform X3 n=1 Tax=Homarus americanus TaxID=6706 RepID=UPI001C4789D5|nr:ubinuclein-1-like isoform X3 [Homarus americanus]
MTEPKKVAFSTLGPIKKEKKREKKVKSLRIMLTLAESNEKSCPEFNYRELVSQKLHERLGKKRLGDVINGPALDPGDPFATDEDAALKALAKQFENRYGGYTPNRKKKRRKENDFSTLGEGYDETDPFIDNSDAFDEVVPTHMETKHRGFYINSGELDFEMVAEESEEEEFVESDAEVRKRKKQTRILSDEEVENEEVEEEEREGNEGDDDEEGHSKKRKLYENGIIRHKKRKLDEGELLRKRKKMIGQFNAKNQEKKDSDQETEKVVNGSESKGETQPNEQSIKASIEAVVSRAREEAGEKKEDSDESASSSSNSSSSDSDSSGSSSSSDSDSEGGEEEEEGAGVENEDVNGEGEDAEANDGCNEGHVSDCENNIPLPGNLPPDLIQLLGTWCSALSSHHQHQNPLAKVINRLKEEGRSSKGSSQKFFTDAVNKLLLSIEIKLNKIGGRKKTQIYNHLSQHLPCGTQTIVKRAKNLLAERHESRLQEPLKRLKETVDSHMPPLVEQHALDCQKAAESKGENGVTQNKDEEGEKKKCKLPKKKFLFTDEVKKLLCEVVSVRVQYWQMLRKRSETPEENIKRFLDTEVRPIWPKGWMNVHILFKESYESHAVITSKSYMKPASVKKSVSLGGGSVTNVSSSVSTQPPKPSLSATVIPKSLPSPVSSTSKGEAVKKKISPGEQKEVESTVKPATERTVSSSGGLSIKSVEKINEEAPKAVIAPEKLSETPSDSGDATKDNSPGKTQSKTVSSITSVSVIDLSSDDDKTMTNKVSSSKSNPVSGSSKPKDNNTSEKDTSAVSSTSVIQRVNSTSEGKKDDNLEEEMNLVMNEILQISKKKSADDTVDKTNKESANHSSVTSTTSKHQNLSQSQVQHQHNIVLPAHKHHTTQGPTTVDHPKHSPPVQQQKHTTEQTSPTQLHKHPVEHHSPVQQQIQSPQHHSPLQQQKQNIQHNSPVQQMKQTMQPNSPVQQLKQTMQPSSPVQQLKQTVQPNSPSQQLKQTIQPSSPVQQLKQTVQPSSPVQQLKQAVQPSSPIQQLKQTVQPSSPVQQLKQVVQPSSPVQQLKQAVQPSSPVQQLKQTVQPSSPVQQLKQAVQPSSPVQNQSQSHSLQQHNLPHPPKQSQQQLTMQQSHHQQVQQQQQQPLNLQQPKPQQSLNLQPPLPMQPPKSQQPLNLHQSNPQYHSSSQHKTSADSSHHKKQSQQYSHSHHQQQVQTKPINISVSSWNKGDKSHNSKSSPPSTNKTHSSWGSSHEVSPSRQRQSEAPIVSSVDPLANLRMMHGLSVSSITHKKTSAATSVYHSPAALATSSIGTYSTSVSKKSSGSSSSSTISTTNNIPAHSGSASLGTTSSKTSSLSYSSSQPKLSTSSHSYSSSSSSKHSSSQPKTRNTTRSRRLDPYSASVSQSLYSSMTPDQQLNAYKQLQQHHQSNQLTPHQQQELWQQLNAGGYLAGVSNSEMLKLMTQMGKTMDSYSSSSQPGSGQHRGQF